MGNAVHCGKANEMGGVPFTLQVNMKIQIHEDTTPSNSHLDRMQIFLPIIA